MTTDHIIHSSAGQRKECQHCGFSEVIKMPAPIDAILGKMDAFTKAHEGCKRSDYVKGFDAGYAYSLNEIERYINRQPESVLAVEQLLAHLKLEKGRENT